MSTTITAYWSSASSFLITIPAFCQVCVLGHLCLTRERISLATRASIRTPPRRQTATDKDVAPWPLLTPRQNKSSLLCACRRGARCTLAHQKGMRLPSREHSPSMRTLLAPSLSASSISALRVEPATCMAVTSCCVKRAILMPSDPPSPRRAALGLLPVAHDEHVEHGRAESPLLSEAAQHLLRHRHTAVTRSC